MVLLEKLWDDVVAGPQPERGLGKLRKLTTLKTDEGESSKLQKSLSMPTSPTTPLTPSTPTTLGSGRKSDNIWRSVFHPGSNFATKTISAQMFDKPLSNTPTVYDWLRRRHRWLRNARQHHGDLPEMVHGNMMNSYCLEFVRWRINCPSRA